MTPTTRPPAASAPSASAPIEPIRLPPYTIVRPARASSSPSRRAAEWYSASALALDAQYTHTVVARCVPPVFSAGPSTGTF